MLWPLLGVLCKVILAMNFPGVSFSRGANRSLTFVAHTVGSMNNVNCCIVPETIFGGISWLLDAEACLWLVSISYASVQRCLDSFSEGVASNRSLLRDSRVHSVDSRSTRMQYCAEASWVVPSCGMLGQSPG